MNPAVHIAVVDDEVDITALLANYLQSHGYRVTPGAQRARADGADGAAIRRRWCCSTSGLPGEDGFAIARQLREHWRCGLVIVTGRGDAVDKVVGLEVGADDYVTKPFDLRELLARIKAVLRRIAPRRARPPRRRRRSAARRAALRRLGARHRARAACSSPRGAEVALTSGEFDLLCTLRRAIPGRVLSRDFLLEQTRGREAGPFDRTIDVQVGRLRQQARGRRRRPADHQVGARRRLHPGAAGDRRLRR